MKKVRTLELRRLTVRTLAGASGGWGQVTQTICFGSYDQGCSGSCDSCVDDAAGCRTGEGCAYTRGTCSCDVC